MTFIKTSRLTLRPIELCDAPRFAALCNDETLVRNTSRLPFPYTRADADAFVKRAVQESAKGVEYRFAVCRKEIIIACAGVAPTAPGVFELGYWVGKDARGGGVATEAASALIHYLFHQLDGQTVTAGFFIDNPASGRVLTKLGFTPMGEIVKTMSLGRGAEVDTARMMLNKADFQSSFPVSIQHPAPAAAPLNPNA